jgi:hypothetical protein
MQGVLLAGSWQLSGGGGNRTIQRRDEHYTIYAAVAL